MINFLLSCIVISAAIFAVMAMGDNMLGPGRWFVRSIQQCPNHEQYEFRFFIQRKKMTRDTDCYNANMTLDKPIDEKYGVRVEICKYVDGGCKLYQILSDESIVNFVNKYAKDNVETALRLAGLDPPEFPLPCGVHVIINYVFDYCQLPTDSVFGLFRVEAYMLEESKEVGCVSFTVEFQELDGACEGEDTED